VQAPPEGHVQTTGQEREEDMSLDPLLRLVINWPDRKIILESLFDYLVFTISNITLC